MERSPASQDWVFQLPRTQECSLPSSQSPSLPSSFLHNLRAQCSLPLGRNSSWILLHVGQEGLRCFKMIPSGKASRSGSRVPTGPGPCPAEAPLSLRFLDVAGGHPGKSHS